MSETRFADGFDRPDPVVLGLTPAPLLAVVTGLVLAYLVARLSLPSWLTLPVAAVVAGAGCAAGWARVQGRPVVEWAGLAARFAIRSRAVEVLIAEAPAAPEPATAPPPPRLATAATARPEPRLPAGARARRVAFCSLAGGSGRTTLAVELACLMAARGVHTAGELLDLDSTKPPRAIRRSILGEPPAVALLDLDAVAPAVALRLGLVPPTLWEFATDRGPTRSVEERLLRHPGRLLVLPGSPRPLPLAAQLAERAALDQTLAVLDRSGAHLVVLDLGRDLGPVTTWGLRAADEIVVVVTPSPGGILDAYRTTAALRRLGHGEKLLHLLNRAAPEETGDTVAEALSDLGGELAAIVPEDPRVRAAELDHRPCSLQPGPAARGIAQLADALQARARARLTLLAAR